MNRNDSMPKLPNQKLKILYISDILLRETDENHPMSMKKLINRLADHGISAERKGIYNDLELLRQYGLDIIKASENRGGYYIGSRDFEIPELKLLVDAVETSKFITYKKSNELIKKLEGLTDKYSAQGLQRQVYVMGRVKTMNESIYYNVDKIHNGISKNKQIAFKYIEYNVNKERVPRHNGKVYHVSPFALNWDSENYYLIGYDPESDSIRHYRVDKMEDIVVSETAREGVDEFEKIDLAGYAKKVFSMYRGNEAAVTIRFDNTMAGVVIDRFGKDIPIVKHDEDTFDAFATVEVSPQFYGWVSSLGDAVKIISPKTVRDSYVQYLKSILECY